MINEREIVLDVVLEVLEKKKFSHLVVQQALAKYGYLEKKQRAFILRLAEGTIERAIEMDAMIEQVSSVKVKKMKPVIRSILRMTAYQIKYMDQIPDSAACNEAVKLAEKRGFKGLKRFVNGVCRNMARNRDAFELWEETNLSVRYSMPQWLIDDWSVYYSQQELEKILAGFYKERHQTGVRCNVSKCPKEHVIKSLENQQVKVEQAPYADTGLLLSGYDRLEELEAFQNGWIQVQDVSSILAGNCAAPKKGDYCMDVCAAPGGKSLHLADQMGDEGVIDSSDLSMEKVFKIEENAMRCGFSCIRPNVSDALIPDHSVHEKADLVLADLPCSGLGIIGNKSDIKYQMTLEKMNSLAALQKQILSIVQDYVKPGGILLYSTCTINPRENIENLRWFVTEYSFEPESLDPFLPDELHSDTTKEGYLQLLPGIHSCAGFFFARLRKKGEER